MASTGILDAVNIDVTFDAGEADAGDITAIKAASGSGILDGSTLTTINGTAEEIVQALVDLDIDPTNFNSTLKGTATAADISAIQAAKGMGIIDGKALTLINGNPNDIIQILKSSKNNKQLTTNNFSYAAEEGSISTTKSADLSQQSSSIHINEEIIIKDTSEQTQNWNKGINTYIPESIDIDITESASITQITKIDALTSGSINYSNAGISDYAKNLTNNTLPYISSNIDIEIIDSVTLEQLTAIINNTKENTNDISTIGKLTFSISSSEASKGIISIKSAPKAVTETIQKSNNFNNFSYKFIGKKGEQSYTGGSKKDLLKGGGGNDNLNGGAGADKLFGESGNDIINGGTGNDKIYGGHGKDILTGGKGKDRFYFIGSKHSKFNNYDSITDLDIGSDKIIVSNGIGKKVENISEKAKKFNKFHISKLLKSNIEANKAYAFSIKATQDTFLFINDSSNNLDFQNDTFIKITGYSGNITNLLIG